MNIHTRLPRTIVQATLIIITTLLLSACGEKERDNESAIPDEEIPELFLDEPDWLASTQASKVTTTEEVLALWQSAKRCCEDEKTLFESAKIFYKSCYLAIGRDPRNEDLVSLCLSLMTHKMPREVVRTIHNHYLENYFYRKENIDDCTHCRPADVVAQVSQEYARSISYGGNYRGAIAAIYRILEERGNEVSPFIQIDLYDNITWYHEKSSFTTSELARLEKAYTDLKPAEGAFKAEIYYYKEFGEALERLKKLEPSDG